VHALAKDGLRTVAIASRKWTGPVREVESDDESNLIFEGLCAFADPAKPTAAAAIARLAAAGVGLKVLLVVADRTRRHAAAALVADGPLVRLRGATAARAWRDRHPGRDLSRLRRARKAPRGALPQNNELELM
jgi:hypothetical protein